jgi:hypothetical protein
MAFTPLLGEAEMAKDAADLKYLTFIPLNTYIRNPKVICKSITSYL